MKLRILKDKAGAEKIFSIWWFLVLVVVGVGVVAGVYIFYSANVDTREVEAHVLYNKISDCIIEQGFLIDDALNEEFDIFDKCGLSKDVFLEANDFYFEINFFNETGNKFREDVREGAFSFEKDCEVTQKDEKGEQIEAKEYPKCARKKQPVLYYENNQIKKGMLEILTASNQKGRKIPIVEGGDFGGGEFGGAGAGGGW